MELILTHTGRLNFTQMARCGRSCESRFRQNFRKSFDWLSFNRSFLESTKGHRIAIAIDPCYISKSGEKQGSSVVCVQRLAYFRQPRQGICPSARDVLSVGSTKTLLHNAAMVDRFIAMSGKSPNMRLNNTDFKELLFYGVRAAV